MFGCDARRVIAALLLILMQPLAAAAELENRLAGHASPYLALHAADPVAWQEWNVETVARAQRENKLIFVSVGYFACHWCHVMQRESYRDPAIAAQLNHDFVPVKVDRELNVGLDDTLQSFSERLNGVAGWPLNAFLTPDGYPAYTVLYAPPAQLQGLLRRLAERWRSDANGVRELARRAAPSPSRIPASAPLHPIQARARFMQAVWQEADLLHGGFGNVAKFPMAPQLDALLEHQARHPDSKLAEFLRLTFDAMATRGLRDHVNGGFFRYTIDPGWETPHFEKMLYDNAQLALLYLRASKTLHEPRYRAVAFDTLDFMRSTLRGAAGGLYSSTSALDAAGREGGAYLWEPEELERLLGPAAYAAARRVWRLDGPRVFEAGYLPAEMRAPSASERKLLDEARISLAAVGRGRDVPVDDKQIAGPNGLALSAFSAASVINAKYRRDADALQRFLLVHLTRGDQLIKAVARGKRLEGAELADYAYVAQGLLDHADATGARRSRQAASTLTRTAWQTFGSPRGWKSEARPLLAPTQPEPAQADDALYAPSEVLLLATLRLGDPILARRARAVARWQIPAMRQDAFVYPSRLRLLERLTETQAR